MICSRYVAAISTVWLISSCVLLSGVAIAAAPTATSLDACRIIEVDVERLACYDRLAERARAQKPHRIDESDWSNNVFKEEPAAKLQSHSMLDARWELDPGSKLGEFNLRAHRPIYLLPLSWASRTNDHPSSPNPPNNVDDDLNLRSLENKFQLSFKTKVWEGVLGEAGDLWFGYTQSSRWQLYNSDESRPFRETNYEPEVMLNFGVDQPLVGDWRARMLGVAAVHQSNGRSLPLSRSWDRLMLNLGFERENWVLLLRPWWRIPESDEDDDNPDIADFIGRADLQLVHHWGEHELAWMIRHSLRGGDRSHGALQFDWSFPLLRNLRGHVQVFDGYGESLIDYNHRATYVGVGVSLLPWY